MNIEERGLSLRCTIVNIIFFLEQCKDTFAKFSFKNNFNEIHDNATNLDVEQRSLIMFQTFMMQTFRVLDNNTNLIIENFTKNLENATNLINENFTKILEMLQTWMLRL